MYHFVQHYDLSIHSPLFQRPQVQLLLEFCDTLVRRVGAENPTSGPSLNHLYFINVFLVYTDSKHMTNSTCSPNVALYAASHILGCLVLIFLLRNPKLFLSVRWDAIDVIAQV